MIIRYVTPEDNPLEISNVYEQSWKYAYRNIIPQSYLNSIPTGKWADSINKNGMSNLVLIEKIKLLEHQVFVNRVGMNLTVMVKLFQSISCLNIWGRDMVNYFSPKR